MRKKSRGWIAVFSPALVLALVACPVVHGQDVVTNYLPGTDFSKYRTYKWVTIEAPNQPDQILDTQIKRSVDSQLGAKGLTKMECGTPDPAHAADFRQPPDLPRTIDSAGKANSTCKPDLLVAYWGALNRERQWNARGWGDGFGWPGMGTADATATSSTIHVGTVVLNMYDPVAKQLVWTGSATKTLNPSKDPQKNQKSLDKAMQKLLKHFPRS